VHALQQQKITVPALVRFYQQLCQAYPHAETLYLVVDNWPVHFHPDVRAALQPQWLAFPINQSKTWPVTPSPQAKRLNLPIQLVQLPTYASWCNPIEKLWRWLKQDVLKMHRLAEDWRAVRDRVRQFLDQFAHGSQRLLEYVGLLGQMRTEIKAGCASASRRQAAMQTLLEAETPLRELIKAGTAPQALALARQLVADLPGAADTDRVLSDGTDALQYEVADVRQAAATQDTPSAADTGG